MTNYNFEKYVTNDNIPMIIYKWQTKEYSVSVGELRMQISFELHLESQMELTVWIDSKTRLEYWFKVVLTLFCVLGTRFRDCNYFKIWIYQNFWSAQLKFWFKHSKLKNPLLGKKLRITNRNLGKCIAPELMKRVANFLNV